MDSNQTNGKQKVFVRHDTAAWKMQVWISFGAAFVMAFLAVWNMPSGSLDRVLCAVSMIFLLSSTFSLSKMLRDNQYEQTDTPAWVIQVWSSFVLSVGFTAWGIYRMNITEWHKMFVVGSAVFLLSAAFTLAKTLRDDLEAKALEAQASE